MARKWVQVALRSPVETGGFPQCSHPLLGQVVVLRAEHDALLTRVGEEEHQACSLALIQLKILLQKVDFLVKVRRLGKLTSERVSRVHPRTGLVSVATLSLTALKVKRTRSLRTNQFFFHPAPFPLFHLRNPDICTSCESAASLRRVGM